MEKTFLQAVIGRFDTEQECVAILLLMEKTFLRYEINHNRIDTLMSQSFF